MDNVNIFKLGYVSYVPGIFNISITRSTWSSSVTIQEQSVTHRQGRSLAGLSSGQNKIRPVCRINLSPLGIGPNNWSLTQLILLILYKEKRNQAIDSYASFQNFQSSLRKIISAEEELGTKTIMAKKVIPKKQIWQQVTTSVGIN